MLDRQPVDERHQFGRADCGILQLAARGGDRRAQQAGVHGDGDDPVVGEAPRQLDGDHVQRRLRRDVADVAADRAGDLHRADRRGHVDDPRIDAAAQSGQEGPAEQHRADGVDADLVEDVLGTELQHIALVVRHAKGPSVDTGVVDQHVEGSRPDRRGELLDRLFRPDVQLVDLAGERTQLVGVARATTPSRRPRRRAGHRHGPAPGRAPGWPR